MGTAVAAVRGIPGDVTEDRLKAMAAAAAATGSVALFHVIGVTPEAVTEAAAFGGEPPQQIITPSTSMLRGARDTCPLPAGIILIAWRWAARIFH